MMKRPNNDDLRSRLGWEMTDKVDDTEFEKEPDKLLLAYLWKLSMAKLTWLEYLCYGTTLRMQLTWDKRAKTPRDLLGGMYSQHEDVPLSVSIISKLMDTDKTKYCSLMKSVFQKEPVLKTLISKDISSQIDAEATFPVNDDNSPEDIGALIRKSIQKADGKYSYRKV